MGVLTVEGPVIIRTQDMHAMLIEFKQTVGLNLFLLFDNLVTKRHQIPNRLSMGFPRFALSCDMVGRFGSFL